MLRATLALLPGCFLLAATVSAAAQVPAEPLVLDCKEMFPKSLDQAALVKRFGRENVTVGQLDGAEGETERGTIIYAKDPARRIEVFWFDNKALRRPASIVVQHRSRWIVRGSGTDAIGIGTPLAAVELINGRPFSIFGFEWDMGGYSAGWKGGRLETMDGGCSLSLRFNPDPKAAAAVAKVAGDKEFASSAAAIKATRPTVSKLSLGWPE